MNRILPAINLIPALAVVDQLQNESLDELHARQCHSPMLIQDQARESVLIREVNLLKDVRNRTRINAVFAVTDGGDC